MDFTDLRRKNKTYAGANGSKISVEIDGEIYMLKFPSYAKHNKEMSYANGCVSEYLGSHIFEMLGIETQKTMLGKFGRDNNVKIVVACKDFTDNETVLQDFASLKNTIIDSIHNGYGTELTDIIDTIRKQQAIDPIVLEEHFWNMFIVDAFIGNWDRHNGNWGFLYNVQSDEIKIAPIYDCGSSLFPQADDEIMENVINDPIARDLRVFARPLSGIMKGGAKINYFDFISSLCDDGCNRALNRIVPRIDMVEINKLIDETPFISNLQKDFYKLILRERKEKILDYSLKLLNEKSTEK